MFWWVGTARYTDCLWWGLWPVQLILTPARHLGGNLKITTVQSYYYQVVEMDQGFDRDSYNEKETAGHARYITESCPPPTVPVQPESNTSSIKTCNVFLGHLKKHISSLISDQTRPAAYQPSLLRPLRGN